mmetsp:Transcript_5774/g.13839  ORF Transcript_5774/g.13839 Transcript_5774/m.13839 type:complete len:591 (-) Transcript_5774:758-2530(-)
MWPRTMEEKNRRRNTGFVCFMRRDDAEEAMEACDETDPFNNGRQIILRWGKSVKKVKRDDSEKPFGKKRQRESVDSIKNRKDPIAPTPPISSKSSNKHNEGSTSDGFPTKSENQALNVTSIPEMKIYDPKIHASRAILVEIPSDQSRFHFISTAASYVAKDPEIEQRLKDEEGGNPLFDFLMPWGDSDELEKEKVFYRWRVYSFCQGDTYSIWRTEPFVMFPNGRYWLPPALDTDAVEREKANAAEKERHARQQKEDRANRELMTGRQFERRKRRGDFGSNSSKLNPEELDRFDKLVRKKLSLSRKTICEAMSFCFDNCVAAREVSDLLKEALLDESDHVTNDMRIARLYLLSDILFNSQQPGVRNAFMYRTTIEAMAVGVFQELGNVVRRRERLSGRITVNKIRKAVSAVLGAWTEWGVYNAIFVDELEDHFEGREVKKEDDKNAEEEKIEEKESPEEVEEVIIHEQRGNWEEVSEELSETKSKEITMATKLVIKPLSEAVNKKENPTVSQSSTIDDKVIEKDVGGNNDHDDVDGEDLDGEDLNGEDLDGEDLDGEDLDGEDLDGEDIDGEDLDGEDMVKDGVDGDEAP